MRIVRRITLLLPLALAVLAGCQDEPTTGPKAVLVEAPQRLLVPITGAQLSAGGAHTCAIGPTDGIVACWGRNDVGQTNVPGDLGAVTQVSAGVLHTCAVKQVDGNVRCWGYNYYGQSSVPADLGAVTLVSAGNASTCAIRQVDGNLRCWGLDATTVPSDLGAVRDVSVGVGYICAVRSDGTVACWGENSYGQAGVPSSLGPVTQVSADSYHTCALEQSGGRLVCWGDNSWGKATPPVDLGVITQVSVGFQHTCAVASDGTLRCWGRDIEGQSTLPASLGSVVQVSAGFVHTCAIQQSDGVVVCWGSNANGQATPTYRIQPTASFAISSASVESGQTFTLTLSDALVAGHPEATTFTYAFDCGNGGGYGAFGPSNSAVCTATRPVRGTVRDQDGDVKEYTGSINVTVPPLPTGGSFTANFNAGASSLLEVLGPVAPTYSTGAAVFTAPLDPERTYLRTLAEYHGSDFVAEVTVTVVGSLGYGAAFFGFGSGDRSNPCQFACEPVVRPTIFARVHPSDFDGGGTRIMAQTSSTLQQIGTTGVGGFGSHRVRMSWTAATQQLAFAIDANHTGGQFVADATLGPYTVPAGVFDATNARIFFGGGANATFDDLVVTVGSGDNTPPVITPNVSGTQGANGWYTSNVAVSWSVVDAESAISSTNGCGNLTVTSDQAATTYTCSAGSAGGTSSQGVTIKRDATPPALAPSVSPDVVVLDGSATASAGASDALSGIATQSCGALATSTVGSKTVSCTATDNAGNTASATASYQVTYGFSGFSAPINDASGVLNVAKAGQIVPLKWRLSDASGAPVTNLGNATLTVVSLSCSAGSSSDQVEEYSPGGSGLQNLGDGYYQYNWKTPKNYSGSCKTMQLDLGEGSFRTALFSFTN